MEDRKNWAWRIAHGLKSKGAPCSKANSVPIKTLMRLRWYMTAVDRFAEHGTEVVSSRELADKLGINSAMVRKDFSYLGELGTPGLGYHVSYLQDQIRGILDQHTCLVVWVGAQWFNNVQGMINDSTDLNFQVIAAFDTRKEWIGKRIGEFEVLPLSDLPAFVSERSVDGAVLALPEDALRSSDMLVQAGLKGILNLTSVMLTTPPEVTVRNIDLIDEMMGLAVDCTEAIHTPLSLVGGSEPTASVAREFGFGEPSYKTLRYANRSRGSYQGTCSLPVPIASEPSRGQAAQRAHLRGCIRV